MRYIDNLRINSELVLVKGFINGKFFEGIEISGYFKPLSKYEYNTIYNAYMSCNMDNIETYKNYYGLEFFIFKVNDYIYGLIPFEGTNYRYSFIHALKPYFSEIRDIDKVKKYADLWHNVYFIDEYEDMEYCSYCNNYYYNENLQYLESYEEFICDNCLSEYFTQCEYCDEYELNSNIQTRNGLSLCEYCAENEFVICSQCGDFIHNDYIEYFNDNPYCGDCYQDLDISDECEYIHSYGHIPKDELTFYGNNSRYFGIEIEVFNKDEIHDLDILSEYFNSNEIYITEDSSLNNLASMEIKNHPMNYEYVLSDFIPILQEFYNSGYRGNYADYGMHIHVSKTSLNGKIHIAKIVALSEVLYENVILKIDRRGTHRSYCHPTIFLEFLRNDYLEHSYDRWIAYSRRNSFWNVEPSNTIECRGFNSTMNMHSIIASVQFIDMICDIANILNIDEILNFDEFDFMAFLMQYHPEYVELKDYLIKRNVYPDNMGIFDILACSNVDIGNLIEIKDICKNETGFKNMEYEILSYFEYENTYSEEYQEFFDEFKKYIGTYDDIHIKIKSDFMHELFVNINEFLKYFGSEIIAINDNTDISDEKILIFSGYPDYYRVYVYNLGSSFSLDKAPYFPKISIQNA